MGKSTNILSINWLVSETIKPKFQGWVDDCLTEVTPNMIDREEVTKRELVELFEKYWATDIRLITDKETWKSRWFAFAEFADDEYGIELAKLTKDKLNWKELIKWVPIQIVFAEKVENLEKLDCTV